MEADETVKWEHWLQIMEFNHLIKGDNAIT
jgi:hypothetical protein